MIESIFWKDKLKQDIRVLRKRLYQRRWSEKSIVLFERELMLSFFSIRALIEAGKITDKASQKKYSFITYPSKGKIVDELSKSQFYEIFDMYSGVEKKLSLHYLTHQFVHPYLIFTEFSEKADIVGVLLCSDWKKNEFLIRLPITLAIEIIEDVIADEVSSLRYDRDKKTGELRKISIL